MDAPDEQSDLWIDAPGYLVIVKRGGEADRTKEFGTFGEAKTAANGWHKHLTGAGFARETSLDVETVYEKRLGYAGWGKGVAEIGILAYHPEDCVCPACGAADFAKLGE